jgi:hypothetical protein
MSWVWNNERGQATIKGLKLVRQHGKLSLEGARDKRGGKVRKAKAAKGTRGKQME